jgi:hypothetical protein
VFFPDKGMISFPFQLDFEEIPHIAVDFAYKLMYYYIDIYHAELRPLKVLGQSSAAGNMPLFSEV